MTTSRNSDNSERRQAFDALCNATTALEICNEVIACIHYQDQEGNEGEPLQLHHHSDIAPYEPVEIAHRRVETDWQTMENWVPRQVRDHFGVEGSIYQLPGLIEAYDQAIQVLEQIDKPIRDLDDTERTLFEKSIEIDRLLIFFKFGALLIQDLAERIELIHSKWLDAREYVTKMPHPLTPIVRAWLPDQIPKVEPERRTDTGILHHVIGETHHAPRLNMTVMETVPGESEQLMLITNLPQVDLQLELPGFEFPESELVPALPLEASETIGGRPSQPGGGAPISQRLFFNILVEYAQKQRGLYGTSRLNTNYRDVKSWLYPKGTTNPKSVLIPRLYKGMYELHNFRFLWERRAWNIISVDSLPTPAIRPDDALTFTVRMPTGMNTSNGALIGIEPMRIYGAQSAPKFRAWVRLAYLWDAAKVRNGGKRIYATVPEVLRNSDGYLVDAKGEIILTGDLYHTKGGWKFRNGNQTQKAWYHPLAIQTGEPMRNPQADKVPVLSESDMVKLFYDHNERRGSAFHSALSEARRYALEMQDESRIVVEEDQENEKTGIKGWRILEPHHG